jgi:hypothetical protein
MPDSCYVPCKDGSLRRVRSFKKQILAKWPEISLGIIAMSIMTYAMNWGGSGAGLLALLPVIMLVSRMLGKKWGYSTVAAVVATLILYLLAA